MIPALLILSYLAIGIIVGRILYIMMDPVGNRGVRNATFCGVAAVFFWPIMAGLGIIVGTLIGIGWLISWPTPQQRRRNRQEAELKRRQEARSVAEKYDLPMPNTSGDRLQSGKYIIIGGDGFEDFVVKQLNSEYLNSRGPE